ncbi:MAG: hypothetical protein NLN66_01765 [Candidatus Thalassarchaeaceae archaeon]|nr:hypothetical protein [Candidatus Thalassarchaeaceae archaeon]
MTDLLNANTYLIRKKLMKILGEEFHIYTDDNQEVMIGYSKQKALKIKEDIRVFSDESQSNEILTIKARNIFDLSGNYDFTDSNTGESLGGVRRNFRKSIFQDSYSIFGPDNQVYGEIKEDSMMNAIIRRIVPFAKYALPQVFSMDVQGQSPITFTQKMNPIIQKLTVQISDGNQLDRRVVLGAAMIVIAIEGKQN